MQEGAGGEGGQPGGGMGAADPNISHDLLAGLTSGSWIRGEIHAALAHGAGGGAGGGGGGGGPLPTIVETVRSSIGSEAMHGASRGGGTGPGGEPASGAGGGAPTSGGGGGEAGGGAGAGGGGSGGGRRGSTAMLSTCDSEGGPDASSSSATTTARDGVRLVGAAYDSATGPAQVRGVAGACAASVCVLRTRENAK